MFLYLLSSRLHSSHIVDNCIGYNSRCGVSFVCNYSCIDYLIGWLIGEIKERSVYVYVPGYDYSTFELYGLWCLKLLTSLILLFCLVHTPICGVNCTFDNINSCLEKHLYCSMYMLFPTIQCSLQTCCNVPNSNLD